jgi:RNA polymerase sigma-70 factor (ECF subfamily)
MRPDLSAEAIRLTRILVALLAKEPRLTPAAEPLGLLALMLLHHARRAARSSPDGELVLLEDQDRSAWDRAAIAEGQAILDQALAMHSPGPYQIQAAISALHAEARRPEETDWRQIVALYHTLQRLTPSLIVELNLAVAVAMAYGPEAGLALLERLASTEGLQGYHLFHAARADLLRRTGQLAAARHCYRQALELCQNGAERAFLSRRLREIGE